MHLKGLKSDLSLSGLITGGLPLLTASYAAPSTHTAPITGFRSIYIDETRSVSALNGVISFGERFYSEVQNVTGGSNNTVGIACGALHVAGFESKQSGSLYQFAESDVEPFPKAPKENELTVRNQS